MAVMGSTWQFSGMHGSYGVYMYVAVMLTP